MTSDARTLIHTIRAKSEGERIAHQRARLAFLRHLIVDTRTRNLFARWAFTLGIDEAIDEAIDALDDAARHAGLTDRSLLKLPADDRMAPAIYLAATRAAAHCLDVVRRTRTPRADEALAFVREEFCSTIPGPRFCTWLPLDLMDIFDAEVVARVLGTTMRLPVELSPAQGTVPKGQRPKHGGEHIERNAGWFYRHVVAASPISEQQLADEYAAGRDVTLSPKEYARIRERADTKLVREGIRDAKRLLELTALARRLSLTR